MIISRGYNSIKLFANSVKAARSSVNSLNSRNSGRWSYRSLTTPTESQNRAADILGGLVWGWIIYHFINDLGEITGEYSSPDPSLWTDEELGIPPDEEGPAPERMNMDKVAP